jgi:hypothetical protein
MVSMRRIVKRIVLALCALVLALPGRAALAQAQTLPAVVYTQFDCVGLFSRPDASSTLLASAIPGTGLRVTGLSGDGQWYHALFLGAMPVWVLAQDVATSYQTNLPQDNSCPFGPLATIAAQPVGAVTGPFALTAAGTLTQATALRSAPGSSARVVADLVPGQRAYITAWAPDANGDVWYLAHAGGTLGWLWAYTVLCDGPDPATVMVHGAPIWATVAGKGLWFTDYLPHHTDIPSLIAATKALGARYLYVRVAETSYGFYDGAALAKLLPVAHRAGIAVVAWVFPYLRNVASDLIMSQAVANFRAPTGDRVDGIVADVETRTDAPVVFAYGQVLRQMVGPDFLLVLSSFNPRGRPSYPFAEGAASFNVISPQDYWHASQDATYGPDDARALLMLSITGIRAELGNEQTPLEETGQMYDMFTYGEPGGNQPSAAEVTGDMQAAKDLGCIGVSFFDLRTASPDELAAFKAFSW